jgi:hypothetical protein
VKSGPRYVDETCAWAAPCDSHDAALLLDDHEKLAIVADSSTPAGFGAHGPARASSTQICGPRCNGRREWIVALLVGEKQAID